MAGHIATAARTDWATPQHIVDAVRSSFGGCIALDPCSNPTAVVCAEKEVRLPEDGLAVDWNQYATVYCNPPFGKGIEAWIRKAGDAAEYGSSVIVLIPAAVSAHYWHELVVARAKAICFVRGRLRFIGAPSTAPFPTAMVFYGSNPVLFMHAFRKLGWTFFI
jgi:phage N-6-adenine-methyltransferase